MQYGGGYYLYPTTNGFNGGPIGGVRCWYSTDLMSWQPKGWAYLISENTWAQNTLWGPEVHYLNGWFYMFFSASNETTGPLRVCVARSQNPEGPFEDYKAPLFSPVYEAFDVNFFADDNGHFYLYWVAIGSGIWGQEIDSNLNLLGSASQSLVWAPLQSWEGNICEAPFMFKNGSNYHLMYSGNSFTSSNYAVGYATSSSPLGPFTKYIGNPILKKDLSLAPPVSGPGTHSIVKSPDGSELFIVYNAHTHPDEGGGDRSLYIDRMTTTGGVLSVLGPTVTCQLDPSTTGSPGAMTCATETFTTGGVNPIGSTSGWAFLNDPIPNHATIDFDTTTGAYTAHITPLPYHVLDIGIITGNADWMPYASIGPNNYVRVKFHIFHAKQADMNDHTQIPCFYLRAAQRFCATSILEVLPHGNWDPGNLANADDLRPSDDPAHPSIYRVDFDPIDVPALVNNSATQGVLRGFEVRTNDPQENGDLGMTEATMSVYPISSVSDTTNPAILRKVYQPGATDAGSLAMQNPATDLITKNYILGTFPGDPLVLDTTDTTLPKYMEAGLNSVYPPPGITIDSTDVPSTRLGIAAREFNPGPDTTYSEYLRVEPGKQYKIKWHMTSTQLVNHMPYVRVRARSVRFNWTQCLEINGALAAGTFTNTMTQQLQIGVGTMNPDRNGNENGGWYTLLMNTPLSPDIRPEFPTTAPLSISMPHLSAQPGPGVSAPSRRDLRLGFEMLDSATLNPNAWPEENGNVTLDRIEVRVHDLVPD